MGIFYVTKRSTEPCLATYGRITDRRDQCQLLVGQRDIPDVYETMFELNKQARVIDPTVDDHLHGSMSVQMMKIMVEDDLAVVQLPDENLIGAQNGEHLLVTVVVVRVDDGERMMRIAVESREYHRAIAHRAVRRRRFARDGQR